MKTPDLDLVEAFLVFAEERNVSRTARRLALSQPAITAKLQRFEAQLGQSVFEMQGKHKCLNALGELLRQELQPHYFQLHRGLDFAQRSWEKGTGLELTVAGRREILAKLCMQWSYEGDVIYKPLDSASATAALVAGEADIAVSRVLPSSEHLEVRPLFVSESVFLISRTLLEQVWKSCLKRKSPSVRLPDSVSGLLFQPALQQACDFWSRVPLAAYISKEPIFARLANRMGVLPRAPTFVFGDWRAITARVMNSSVGAFVPSDFVSSFKDNEELKIFSVPEGVTEKSTFYFCYPKVMRDFIDKSAVLSCWQ